MSIRRWAARLLGSLREVRRRFLAGLIADVPDDLAVCEFDCPKNQCRLGEWAHCERRHFYQTAISVPASATAGVVDRPGRTAEPCRDAHAHLKTALDVGGDDRQGAPRNSPRPGPSRDSSPLA